MLQISALVAGLNTATAGLNGLDDVLSETPSTSSRPAGQSWTGRP
ncbi:MAG: hypothetical protein ACLPKI_12585 [Streptosporangiaceae bacterium]